MREHKFEHMLLYEDKVIRKEKFLLRGAIPHVALIDGMKEIYRQCTGLKDKKDVEICEGDIVTRWNIEGRNTKRKAEVIFSQGSIVAIENKDLPSEKRWNLWSMCKSFEVIGNIYEDKDLLK